MSDAAKVAEAMSTVLTAAFADKIWAAHIAQAAELVKKVHTGELTVEQAYSQARFKDGDALDQALKE